MDKFIPYGTQEITEDDIKEVETVLRNEWLTGGQRIPEFEKAVLKYLGMEKNGHAIAVSNGTAALEIAVASLQLEKDSEIITTPFTFAATSNCILYNNCRPVFADIKKDTFNIDPEQIRKKITPKTKAIIYVDYAGQPCDIDEIKKIAEENNLFLIEDAAHAIGAEYKGKKVGNFADLTTFSFHPVKTITTGEGGMIVTKNPEFARRAKILRNHGIDKEASERLGEKGGWEYDMKVLGRNYRITDFQCALGTSQLKRLDDYIEKRKKIAEKYNKAFAGLSGITAPSTEATKGSIRHAWHIYTPLISNDRNSFFAEMRKQNIGVNLHYIPVYKFSYYKHLAKQGLINFDEKDFPAAEEVFSKIITLPLFPKMTDEEIEKVIDTTNNILKKS